MKIADLRQEYLRAALTEKDVDPDPLQQFQRWLARGEGDALAAALARLRGDDPATVIRRTYVRLLMLGARAHHPRAPDQTIRRSR